MDHTKFNHISTFIFDVDGVLTDGSVLITEEGDLLRRMNVRDGQAIKIALDSGYHIGITTKGASKGVKKRLAGLGIKYIFDRLPDKKDAFYKIQEELSIPKKEILYMGDDLPDLEVADMAGIFACPANAVHEVLSRADYISPFDGGHTCVREIIERIMRIQNKWPF